jgi:hypothetical protein
VNVDVNYLAVLLAALSSFVVGMIWYSKPVFGKTWSDMVKLTEAQQKKGMVKAMAFAFFAALLMAYIVAHVAFLSNAYFGNSFLQDALSTAFWLGIGVAATTIITHDAFEQRRMKLTAINIGNQLATVLTMGLIIGLMK